MEHHPVFQGHVKGGACALRRAYGFSQRVFTIEFVHEYPHPPGA